MWPDMCKSFNPRTRTGCDAAVTTLFCISSMLQSTHPHGGATLSTLKTNTVNVASIHAPARGATMDILIKGMEMPLQSTHPRGVRHGTRASMSGRGCFNPRTARGATPLLRRESTADPLQSTHPRGVRPQKPLLDTCLKAFAVLCFTQVPVL